MSLNRCVLQGRLVADPELRQTNGGISVANLRIAVDRNFKDADGNKGADFFNCTAWRGTADFIAKYFHKGEMIVLDGKLQNSQYTDKNGENRTVTQIVVDSVYFCGGKGDGNGGGSYQKHEEEQTYDVTNAKPDAFQEITDGSEDELPF